MGRLDLLPLLRRRRMEFSFIYLNAISLNLTVVLLNLYGAIAK